MKNSNKKGQLINKFHLPIRKGSNDRLVKVHLSDVRENFKCSKSEAKEIVKSNMKTQHKFVGVQKGYAFQEVNCVVLD